MPPADVDDDLWVPVKAHRRLGMRYRFHQGDVGVQHFLQDVFGVAGRAHAQNFQDRALRFHLLAQILEEINGVLDRVALGELVGLREEPRRDPTSTAFVEVDPPSRPTTARTC